MDVLKEELISTSTYVPAQLTKDKLKLLLHHIDTLTIINVKNDKCELSTFDWLPKLHKILLSKIEKVPRAIQCEKSSKDMASSGNLVSKIGV